MQVSVRSDDHIDVSRFNDALKYERYFTTVAATTPSLLNEAYRLRYQVYCVENEFERAACEGIEADDYDAHAVHAVVIYRPTRQVCGCVRLILPGPGLDLPVHHMLDEASREVFREFPEATTAEVSRYAVSKQFRRRLGEAHFPDVHFFELSRDEQRRLMPHLTLGLMIAVARLSVQHDITHVCAVMARPFLRLLSRFGMEFRTVGPTVEYHGVRQPCIAPVADLLAGVERRHPSYFDLIIREFRDDGGFDDDAVGEYSEPASIP
jgi:N-acyl amino acid synthase of PEP-CTERM/exosortase system